MVNKRLIGSYLKRAKVRREILNQFMLKKSYSDVIRESQEIIELLEKAILLNLNVTPPKWHDVIDLIIKHSEKLKLDIKKDFKKIEKDCKWLRSQREISFYGDMDFIPEDFYGKKDAEKAIKIVNELFRIIEKLSLNLEGK
ncbi:MAG TPA: HEPN domain-containing protein [bacterium]|nr:HEPN domain-containing protein [bacterium]HOM27330.1 HEPN domain-containing protein [bacterium]